MANISNSFYVYIDSKHRLSGTDSNFTYPIKLPDDREFTHVALLNALIPKSYYLIQDGGNTFQLQEGLTIVTITIPLGNYLLNTWKAVLTSLLNSNSPNSWVYAITYPNISSQADTGKFTYSVTGNTSQPSLIFDNILYEPFGFLGATTNAFTANSLVSATVLKLQSEDRLIIHSSLVNNPNSDNILISINAATSVPFSSVSWINYAPEYRAHRLMSQQNKTASFSLTNEHGTVLDLNGLNMNLTLIFYKEDNIYDVIRNFIKIMLTPKNSPNV